MREHKLKYHGNALRHLKNRILKDNKTSAGFTFIEIILYIALVVLMLTTLVPFAWNIIGTGAKNATEQEVFANARYISDRLRFEIQNATNISTMSATQITLTTPIPSTNPTLISWSGGNLTIKQGAGGTTNLNSQNASISALTFTNYSSSNNLSKNIQFVFTVKASYIGAGPRQEFNESTTVESAAEVRSN